ncbi:MAG: alpha/beta hydrolase [Alphaproteobacteria bacterium]|nr:alpha/beta hydrolase [Alphaproteobacteria bacterium]
MALDPPLERFAPKIVTFFPKPIPELTPQEFRSIVETAAKRSNPFHPPGVTAEDLTADLPGAAIPVRIYRPKGDRPHPAILWLHGGGFVAGSIVTHDPVCAGICASASCTVIAANYRLAPEHPYPAAQDDALGLLRWAVGRASALGIDPERLAVGGDSAGATLAIGAAQRLAGVPRLRLLALAYPVTDGDSTRPSYADTAGSAYLSRAMMEYFLRHYLPGGTSAAAGALPLRSGSLEGLPPTFVVTAGHDPLHDEGVALVERLRAAGVAVDHRNAETMPHEFLRYRSLSKVAEAEFQAMCGVIAKALR